ncbi:MAG TPA: hypothetical protein VGU64_20830 [Terriglobales bacterium]|nr:hypothetical protein [Terriglobales bacterium]
MYDPIPGAMPQAQACTAPLALKMYVITDQGPLTHLPGPKVAAVVSDVALGCYYFLA